MGKEAKACKILVIIGNGVKFWQGWSGHNQNKPIKKEKEYEWFVSSNL
jgi:hypothetical protein